MENEIRPIHVAMIDAIARSKDPEVCAFCGVPFNGVVKKAPSCDRICELCAEN